MALAVYTEGTEANEELQALASTSAESKVGDRPASLLLTSPNVCIPLRKVDCIPCVFHSKFFINLFL